MSNIPVTAVGNKCGIRPQNDKEAVPDYNLVQIASGVYTARTVCWWNEGDGVEVIDILPKGSLVIIGKGESAQTGMWSKEQFVKVRAEKVDSSGFVEGWIMAKHLHKMRDV